MSSTTALRIPDAPAIDGLEFRRLRDGAARADDYAAMAELATIANIHDRIPWAPTPESLAAELENSATSDPAVDLILAEIEGELVASASTERAIRDGEWVHDVSGIVHPHWRRRGLGRALLRANVARARQVAAGSSDAAVLSAHADETEAGNTALLQSEGFTPVRWYVLMVRDLGQPVPAVPLPPGLEVRPVLPEHHEVIRVAENEAFRDHWGHREMTNEDLRATLAQPDLDASLWQVAWDGNEIAGVVQNWIWRGENERLGLNRGWLERVSVRRAWRRRGLARALIARSLSLFQEAGLDDAALGVDLDNPQGALGLYESTGFRTALRSTAYRRQLDR